jgi:uncharacterized protein (DUF488 family)
MQAIRTVGHGTLDVDALVALLQGAGIDVIADVRRYPGSRRHPHFGREAMERWLADAGIDYRWLPELGGRRRVRADSPNVALRNDQFRAYADHMATDEFVAGCDELRSLAEERSVAALCSESVWWRCHRRLLSDHLVLVHGIDVEHLFHDGRLTPHVPQPEARVVDGVVVYDAIAEPNLFTPASTDGS